MSDNQDGCEWVNVFSGTGLPGQSRTKGRYTVVCVCVWMDQAGFWHGFCVSNSSLTLDYCVRYQVLVCMHGGFQLGIVELCAKILQIMRNDFKDYARTFCQLCAPFSIQISIKEVI